MARYCLTISYDGGDFEGFQIQPNKVTVQGEIEKAFAKRFSHPVTIVASGRTDSGVHAIGQVAHFDTDKIFDIEQFPYSINALLPSSLAIVDCKKVADNFHARYNAKSKTYIFKLALSNIHCPLIRRYYDICHYELDVQKMREACKYVVGMHDFRSFMLADSSKENTVRTVYDLHIDEYADGKELWFVISGNGFLHNMVRIIVGTIVDVGRGRFEVSDIKKILDAKCRCSAGKTLAACGLYLKEVCY